MLAQLAVTAADVQNTAIFLRRELRRGKLVNFKVAVALAEKVVKRPDVDLSAGGFRRFILEKDRREENLVEDAVARNPLARFRFTGVSEMIRGGYEW